MSERIISPSPPRAQPVEPLRDAVQLSRHVGALQALLRLQLRQFAALEGKLDGIAARAASRAESTGPA